VTVLLATGDRPAALAKCPVAGDRGDIGVLAYARRSAGAEYPRLSCVELAVPIGVATDVDWVEVIACVERCSVVISHHDIAEGEIPVVFDRIGPGHGLAGQDVSALVVGVIRLLEDADVGLRREYLRSYAEFFETIVGAAEVGVKSEVLSWIGEQRDRDQEDVVVSAAAMVCIDQCQRAAEIKNLGQIRKVVVEIVSISGIRVTEDL